MCDKGGDLLLENKSIGLNEEGHYVSYNGGKISHGVTQVKKGFRRTLVIWLRPNKFNMNKDEVVQMRIWASEFKIPCRLDEDYSYIELTEYDRESDLKKIVKSIGNKLSDWDDNLI